MNQVPEGPCILKECMFLWYLFCLKIRTIQQVCAFTAVYAFTLNPAHLLPR